MKLEGKKTVCLSLCIWGMIALLAGAEEKKHLLAIQMDQWLNP